MNKAYTFDVEPFENDFEFDDTPELFDEFAEEVDDPIPEYGEDESWSFDPEWADVPQDESLFREIETVDWEYRSALNVLSPSELKAVRITSTFETGRAGGFGGLTGNIDGQGLSFGLLNFTIKAGSLIPLLKEFINTYPARYAAVFGKDAERFRAIVFATKPDPANPKQSIRDVDRQMAFVNNQMNAIPKKARGNRIIEPWKTYFGRLENDPEFRKIQVKAVRRALDRARYWFNYFGLKTERGFAFMFDLVSSHGGYWLDASKFKGARRALLQRMLAAKKAKLGRDALIDIEKMEVIANMIADVSLGEWRERVRVRKLWFVRGSGKVHGSLFDIKKDFGITDNAPDFGHGTPPTASATEFAWEWYSGNNDEQEFEQRDVTSVPTLFKCDKTSPPRETLCVKISLGINVAPNKVDPKTGKPTPDAKFFKVEPMTGIFIPQAYVPRKEVDIVLYLHGHKGAYPGNSAAINDYWNGNKCPFFALREEVNGSGQNVIFVAPTLGPLSQAGNLTTAKGFDSYLTKVLAALNTYFVRKNSQQEVKNIGKIILAAHSGGGSPMLRIAELKGSSNTSKIAECWGFDSVYGNVEKRWVNWAQSHQNAKLFIYYYDTASRSKTLEKLSKASNLQNVCVHGRPKKEFADWARSHPALKKSKADPHFWVPVVYLKERLQNSPCRATQAQPATSVQYRRPRTRSELEVSASTGIDWRAVKNKAVALAKQEYERWDRGHRHETNPKYFETLKKYYVETGLANAKGAEGIVKRIQCVKQLPSGKWTRCHKVTPPWSAAFISWIMKAAGAGKYFACSAGHYVYVSAAKKNRLGKKTENPFWAYRISEVKPEVGDLICNARCSSDQPERCGATFNNVDNGTSWSLHCDIVVDVRSDHIVVIGGNTGDQYGGLSGSTVGMKKVLLDKSGKVRNSQRTNYIAVIKFRTDAGPALLLGASYKETTPFVFEYEPLESENE